MNLCILDSDDEFQVLPVSDRRAQHILRILGKRVGDRIRAGTSDGRLGYAIIDAIDNAGIALHFLEESLAPPLRPLMVLLGTVRPIQGARIVKDLASLGVASIVFFPTALGEKSYTQSNFYRRKEYIQHALDGAEQAGNPRLPEISIVWSLKKALEAVEHREGTKLVCHPESASLALSQVQIERIPVILAIGTERGWAPDELALFERADFSRCALGDRILKTETAAITAVSVILSKLNFL
jgi:RsmE family RNA methyltransferase